MYASTRTYAGHWEQVSLASSSDGGASVTGKTYGHSAIVSPDDRYMIVVGGCDDAGVFSSRILFYEFGMMLGCQHG